MITINERVLVPYPPDLVWSVISDPSKVVGCIEGSEIRSYNDDGTFDAQLAVKFAAIKVSFGARASLELEEDQQIGRLEARGSDTRGSTRVTCNASFAVVPEADGSVVDIDGAVELNGHLASLVNTGAAVVVSRMTRAFAARLTAVCAEISTAPAPSLAVASATVPAVAFAAPHPDAGADALPVAVAAATPVVAAVPEPLSRRVLAAVASAARRAVRWARTRLQSLTRTQMTKELSSNTEEGVQTWHG